MKDEPFGPLELGLVLHEKGKQPSSTSLSLQREITFKQLMQLLTLGLLNKLLFGANSEGAVGAIRKGSGRCKAWVSQRTSAFHQQFIREKKQDI